MSAQLETLTAQVAQTLSVERSAVVLIQGIAAQVAAAAAAAEAGDLTAVTILSADLNSSAASLSAAVVANTPVATPSV